VGGEENGEDVRSEERTLRGGGGIPGPLRALRPDPTPLTIPCPAPNPNPSRTDPPFSTGALFTPVPSVVTSPQSNCAIMSGLFAYAVPNLLDKLKVADGQPGFWKQQKRWYIGILQRWSADSVAYVEVIADIEPSS
jgi:hypothetical protein